MQTTPPRYLPSLDAFGQDGGPLHWGYDPRKHGALCDRCSLQGQRVVPSEIRAGSLLYIVAEAPGRNEELLGFPLCGPSGDEVEQALEAAGISRQYVSLCNAMGCRAPEMSRKLNYDAHLRALRVRNAKRKAQGLPELLPPHIACRPRLLEEIKGARALVLIGKQARLAVVGLDKEEELRLQKLSEAERRDNAGEGRASDVDEFGEDQDLEAPEMREARIPGRGFPGHALLNGRLIPCLTTVHPAFVLRNRRWTMPFRSDIAKAVRMARGQLRWIEPEMIFFPTPEQLRNFLFSLPRDKLIAYDTETDSIVPTEAHLRCIGIGNKERAICVPFRTVEPVPSWGGYSRDQKDQIRRILVDWFGDTSASVVAQNEKYDRTVLTYCGDFPGFVMGRRVFDTAVGHHVAWSELPHDLDFLIAQYLDAPHHKGKRHDRWTSDYELHRYCMLDASRTAEVAGHLLKEEALLAQVAVVKKDLWLSSTFCRGMNEIGFRLDIAERDRLYNVLGERRNQKEAEARALAKEALDRSGRGTPGAYRLAGTLNPNSFKQVGKVLFEALEITPAPEKAGGFTDSGEPSTKEEILYYIMDTGLPDTVERLMLAIIDYRGATKLQGTYCKVQPGHDGRVRSSWNAHVVVSGRLSGSKPNLMNLERSIRSMYTCEPGHVLIACDKAQGEARIVAWEAQDQRWIDAFLAGKDIHKVNACDLLGIPRVEDVSKGQRQFTKTFVYAINYGAGLKKACQMIRSFVDPITRGRPYRERTLGEIALCYRRFWSQHAALTRYYDRGAEIYRTQGFLESSMNGRRRYFLDGGDTRDAAKEEELKNYRIQACLADDVNDATERVVDVFPWGYAGKYTGIVHQCHDALVLETTADRAMIDGPRMVELMFSRIGDVDLPVDLAIGVNYKDKTEYVQQGGVWTAKN
ncbi:MAG: hypothetical protein COZ05_08030 [Armatimonadetes bacterium CG_4_10_14_3_um_filter_59_10]|nr:MAG: hypothetical protein COZ05_08030 [Armatimonadetes bacterium CG_4_10_14_3_um_filter_59_10]